MAATTARLGYKEKNDGVTRGLLSAPETQQWDVFTCLNSLRDVEPPVNLIICQASESDAGRRGWTYGTPPANVEGDDEMAEDETVGEEVA
jgi:hypothetical protein